jgi:hypothetical protein
MARSVVRIVDGEVEGKSSDKEAILGADAENAATPGFESPDLVTARVLSAAAGLIDWVREHGRGHTRLLGFETALIPRVFAVGRLLIQLFLACREEKLCDAQASKACVRSKWFTRQERKPRTIRTVFGLCTFFRTYFSRDKGGSGFHPLDKDVGLTTDGFSLRVVSIACRLASQMPYQAAANLFSMFLGSTPSHTTIEEMVLGLGAYARAYMEQAAVVTEGDVLVIQIDLKCAPTARESELRKRRGKRRPNPYPESARHRGRAKRRRARPKQRRKKADKRKNGRAATLVVMYTLKLSSEGLLLGPFHKKQYASFAGKRYGFAWAKVMAQKMGFGPDDCIKSGGTWTKRVQFVSDGDPDFRVYLRDYFGDYRKDALVMTLDLPHVMEYVWAAGTARYCEGSDELGEWAATQKDHLLQSRADLVIRELQRMLGTIPKQGPGNKGKRERLEDAIHYLETNLDRIDYKYLRDQDLELASGACEGAVNHVVGKRFDHGGMRWIVGRAEALLQLRCIELNGEWDDFIRWFEEQINLKNSRCVGIQRILRAKPVSLPTVASLPLAA